MDHRLLGRIGSMFVTLLLSVGCTPARVEHGGGRGGATYVDPPDVHVESDHIRIDQRIHFATDSDELLESSNDILDQLADVLNHHPEITAVHIVGHTDNAGGDEHNQDLSNRRAASVEAALRARNVTQTMDSRGAGETEPLCHEDTPDCRAQNRRVEFAIESAS
jgi:outer membrane protein OmpA-like peptidoglycan-associated protein